MTAPGWFPDPSDPRRRRYFDGTSWTDHYLPAGPPTSALGPPTKRGLTPGMKIGMGVGAAALTLTALATIGGNDKPSTTNAGSGTTSRLEVSPPTSTRSGFTPSQDNAIEKARSYLRSSAFSRQGLIEQLEYNKYSAADATLAVEHIEATGGVDWNEQALKKAKSYLRNSSFSLESLIEQLEYNGFTPAQAQYGAITAYGG